MDEQQLQQQIIALVQAALQGDQQATQYIQQVMQAAQQGDQQAAQLAQMIQTVAQQMQQQQVQAAKFGAKLNYIKQLRGQCPDGYEMQYFKEGGSMGQPARYCKKCVAKQKKMEEGGQVPSNPVDAFKCGRKMNKKENGGSVEFDKCGKKMKKKACGGNIKKAEGGTTLEKQETQTSNGTRKQTIYKKGKEFLTRNISGNDTIFTQPNGQGPANTPNNPLFKGYNKAFEQLWNSPNTIDNTIYDGGMLPELTVYGKRK